MLNQQTCFWEVFTLTNNKYQTTISALLRRAEIFLEDKEWSIASDYYENALDIDPENAQAYIGLLMASLQITKESDLAQSVEPFNQNKYFLKALRFADSEYAAFLQKINDDNTYFRAQKILHIAKTAADFGQAKALLQQVAKQMDIEDLIKTCEIEENRLQQKERYEEARGLMNNADIPKLNKAIQLFQEDGSEEAICNIEKCRALIQSMEEEHKKRQRNKKIAIVSTISTTILIIILILSSITSRNDKKAKEIYNNFLGQTFSASIEDDDGFAHAHNSGKLNPYTIYWKTTEEKTLKFNDNGTVNWTFLSDHIVLAYPENISKPDESHSKHNGAFDSFSVSVALDGTVYLHISGQTCKVSVDSNNIPQAIYDYYGMTLR